MVPRITATENLELAVSRLTLESLVQDLVDRTMEVTKKAVSEAGLQASEIDDIILVGGQTRMPKLREAIAALFRKDPSRTVHPEEVVAIGAAVHASSISEPEGASTVLLDVTPFDLGIDVAGGLFQTIIARNSPVPATAAQVFATAQERQETIRLTIRQGESRFAEENESGRVLDVGAHTCAANGNQSRSQFPFGQQRHVACYCQGTPGWRKSKSHHPKLCRSRSVGGRYSSSFRRGCLVRERYQGRGPKRERRHQQPSGW